MARSQDQAALGSGRAARGYDDQDPAYANGQGYARPDGRATQARPAANRQSAAQPNFQPYAQPARQADPYRQPQRANQDGYADPYPAQGQAYASDQQWQTAPAGRTGRRNEAQWSDQQQQQDWGQQQGYADPYAQPQAGEAYYDGQQPQTPLTHDPNGYYAQEAQADPYGGQAYDPAYARQQGQNGYAEEYAYDPNGQPAEDEAGYDDQGEDAYGEEPRRGRRGLIVAGALVAAVAIGGGLGFVYKLTSERVGGDNPPVLTADKRPVKKQPDDPGGKAFDGTKKSIYERLGTNGSEDGSAEAQVVSGEEQVVARAGDEASSAAMVPGISTSLPGMDEQSAASGNGEATDASAAPAAADETAGTDASASGGDNGAPKKVATVMVKPGETITSDSQPTAMTVPKPKKILEQAADASGGIDTDGDGVPDVAAEAPAKSTKKTTKAAMAEAIAAAGDGDTGATGDPAAVDPQASAQPAKSTKKKATVVASADPTAGASATETASAGGGAGGYVVQVRSSKSRVDALGSFADLQQKHADLLGSSQPDIREVDLGGKGKWYRLRIGPPGSKKSAGDLCKQLKAAGQDCIVSSY